mmetsp:Transcript_9619/g.22338  ORF Transcript_9619/g.22338 Transcript_9619/m.22338 type:complete len:262 (+) Transcript_9619:144-929(+)
MAASGGDSGAKAPGDLSSARNSVAWPPAPAAASRTAAGSIGVTTQRCAPPHSMSCSPRSLSSGAVLGSDSRHSRAPLATARSAPMKNSSVWSRRPVQKGSARSGGITSPPSLRRAEPTAASAPARRSSSAPSHQALASIGSGWPPQLFRAFSASGWLRSKRSVATAAGSGSTFSVTSVISPSWPIEPASARLTSKPATFFITVPPKLSSSPRPLISTAPSRWSRTEPRAARAGPDRPAATMPPTVPLPPKRGGSKAKRWRC